MNDRLKKIMVVIIVILLALLAVLFINNKKTQTKNVNYIKENEAEIQETNINVEERETVDNVQAKTEVKVEKAITSIKSKPVAKTSTKKFTQNLNEVNKTFDSADNNAVDNKVETSTEDTGIVEVTREYKMKGGDKIRFQGVNYIIKHRTSDTQEK